MENNNNNGRGIFYGVIGVATLIVTMIGATFAYFSASVGTGNEAINTAATTIDLELSGYNTTGLKYQLIPVKETLDGFAKGGFIGDNPSDANNDGTKEPMNANCVDTDGNEFCSVYSFTIKNPSTTTSQKVYARIDVASNTFTVNSESGCSTSTDPYCGKTNLAYAIFKGTPTQVIGSTNGWNVTEAAVTAKYTPATDAQTAAGNTAGTEVVGKLGDMVVGRTATKAGDGYVLPALEQTLKPGGEVTYTVLMWLHETDTNQEADEGKAFAAGITFSTSLGGSGVTAVLGAAQ